MRRIGILLVMMCVLVVCFVGHTSAHATTSGVRQPVLKVLPVVVAGDDPMISVGGLEAGQSCRLHAGRVMSKETDAGVQPVALHSWLDLTADEMGNATVTRHDALALLRNGHVIGSESGADALDGVLSIPFADVGRPIDTRVELFLEVNGAVAEQTTFELAAAREGLTFMEVREARMNGMFARPAPDETGSESPLPIVIILHGSEGGGIAQSRAAAGRFASEGFAAFAINYFTKPEHAIEGVPTEHVDIPIEVLARVRKWLSSQDGLDLNRIALYGHSKGAEFALVAAAESRWLNSVVAVAPSDVVWQGYDATLQSVQKASSWARGSRPMPFVPLFDVRPEFEGQYRSSTERYSRSRRFHWDQEELARIKMEKIRARVLLLAGDRDEVWPSGDMARSIAEWMVTFRKGDLLSMKIYPRAGHQIAGSGVDPVRLSGEQSDDPAAKDLVAEGAAAADAWDRTLAFLRAMETP